MKELSIGKIRGLQQIANTDGILNMCAMDHRGSLRRMINEKHPEEVRYEQMVERKLELCSCLAPHASAVLLDPIFGATPCISHGIIPKSTGLLVSIEASGYEGNPEHRLTTLLEGWNVEKIKRMGASAVKILVHYRPDLNQLAAEQLNTVNLVATECIKYDVPFLAEPKSYPIGTEINNPEELYIRKGDLVINTAKDFATLPVDVLKTEFPAELRHTKDKSKLIDLCHQLDMSLQIPWVILSAGVEFEVFCQQVEVACQAGASGFLGGRAIWQEATNINNTQKRIQYLSTVAVDRLKRLNEIASKYAVPWYKKLGLAADELLPTSERWYEKY